MPGQVVVRARGIADAPVRHGAFRIVLQRLLEALDRLAMVEAEHPVEAAVEPELRVRRGRGDFSAIGPEIEVGHVIPLNDHSSSEHMAHQAPDQAIRGCAKVDASAFRRYGSSGARAVRRSRTAACRDYISLPLTEPGATSGRLGSCVTGIAGPNGGAQLYGR